MWYKVWNYLWTNKWTKDWLRANILFILLVVIYQLLHFQLQEITFSLFFKCWLLLNLCLLAKTAADHYLFKN